MKGITTITLVVLALFFIFVGGCKYNGFVNSEQDVENAWSKVQSAYQRRADLIPNLVNTVKGYADHEKSTLEAVVNARAKATGITIDPKNLTPETLKQFQGAQSGLTAALSKLLLVQERYPDLKANKNFLELQSQLEGTENRIKVARDQFNNTVTSYNKQVKKFPSNFFASIFGFAEKARFQAQEGSENAPKVEF